MMVLTSHCELAPGIFVQINLFPPHPPLQLQAGGENLMQKSISWRPEENHLGFELLLGYSLGQMVSRADLAPRSRGTDGKSDLRHHLLYRQVAEPALACIRPGFNFRFYRAISSVTLSK